MVSLEIKDITEVYTDPEDRTVKFSVKSRDGQDGHITLDIQTFLALSATVHRQAQDNSNPKMSAEHSEQIVKACEPQSVRLGHNLEQKIVALQFDTDLPSESNYLLNEDQFWILAREVREILSAMRDVSKDKLN